MAVPPDRLGAVAAVPCHLGPQTGLVHGGEVHLDERTGHAHLAVHLQAGLGVGVGADAPRTAVVRPVLPGVFVPAPYRQLEASVVAGLGQGDVATGDGCGVAQEERVGGALPRSWRGPLDQASAGPGEPPVEGGGARRRVGAGALHERAATQPDEAVVHGPLRTLGQCDELRRGEHPVGVQ